jgi:hypothetical protein
MMDKLRQQKQKLLDPEAGQPTPSEANNLRASINSLCPSLSYQERVIGFITCFVLGFLLSVGSTFRLARLVRGNPAPFAIAYTIGNLLSLCCTMFFVGPCKQIETMFHSKRRWSAVVYLGFMVLTLVLCFSPHIPHRVGVVLLSVVIQFSALVWYTLSFVPYGRSMFRTCCKRMCGMATEDDV